MKSGDSTKTTSYRIDYWWPTQGNHDMKLGGQVGTWIAQNSKALDKKRAHEVAKLLHEQFPFLTNIEARHVQLQHARIDT